MTVRLQHRETLVKAVVDETTADQLLTDKAWGPLEEVTEEREALTALTSSAPTDDGDDQTDRDTTDDGEEPQTTAPRRRRKTTSEETS